MMRFRRELAVPFVVGWGRRTHKTKFSRKWRSSQPQVRSHVCALRWRKWARCVGWQGKNISWQDRLSKNSGRRSFFRLLAGDHFVPTFGRRPFLFTTENMITNSLRSLPTLVALNILCSFTEDLFCAFCRGVRAWLTWARERGRFNNALWCERCCRSRFSCSDPIGCGENRMSTSTDNTARNEKVRQVKNPCPTVAGPTSHAAWVEADAYKAWSGHVVRFIDAWPPVHASPTTDLALSDDGLHMKASSDEALAVNQMIIGALCTLP